MTERDAEGRLDPQSLRLADLARILSAAGSRAVAEETLRQDIAEGAPTNADGTVNLVHYTAWLVREMRHGD